jgi:hypothetical protein
LNGIEAFFFIESYWKLDVLRRRIGRRQNSIEVLGVWDGLNCFDSGHVTQEVAELNALVTAGESSTVNASAGFKAW